MAEQKTYSIKIDGIEQATKGVENLGTAVNNTSKTFDDYARVVDKLQKYKDAYARIEEAEFKKQIKNQYELKKARETVAAGMGQTYAEQQKYLTALGKVIKNTEGDVSGLIKEYNALNDKLKQVDATMGNHQRNVGNYTSALGNFNKPFSGIVNVTKSAISAFQLYNGVMTAFGASTEESTKAMEKLMSTMSIIQSLNELNNTLKQGSVMGDLFTKAMNAMALGIKGTTTATKALRVAFMGIGIGLIIGLIAALVEHWDDLKKAFTDTFPILKTLSDRFNGLKGTIIGVGMAIKNALMFPFEKLGKAFMKLINKDFKGAISELTSGWGGWLDSIKKGFYDGVAYSKQTVDNGAKDIKKTIKSTNKEIKDNTEKMLEDLVNAEKKAQEEIKKEREAALKAEKDRLERLKKLKSDNRKAENDYQKAVLKLELQNAETEEEKIRVKEKIIKLDQEIAEEEKKIAASDALGISIEELNKRLSNSEITYMGLNEEQKLVMQTLITQLATIKKGAEAAKEALSGSTSGSTSGGTSGKTGSSKSGGNQFMDFENNGGVNWGDIGDKIIDAYDAYAAPIVEGLGDSIHMMLEFAIEEAEAALEEAEALHDEAVDKVSESKDRISELNDKMAESSGAQLEAYKTQMADEMLLLQQREQEEKRLQKEKEKREKELEKQKKKQRKLELQQQLVQAIVSGALAVVNGLATTPFMPVGIAMGALAAVATAIQIATITKQMSKLADGGLLSGKSHSQGGIPVGNTGIEVEGGEYVVNKRSTAKYLPLLQQINEEGARKKTVANTIGKMADGGTLNYERINSNMDALNTAKIVSTAIEGIEMHPVVSVVDINRGQRNMTEVRELAGAS